MAFKYVVFRENWVGSKVAGMKVAFFAIFDPTWVHIWPQKDQNMEFLKQNFSFQSFRKIDAIILLSMWFKDWLTKYLLSKSL